jgi:histidinol-phosphate/aromatic aminotransferase/cobyric acid decarboxylase-like protein
MRPDPRPEIAALPPALHGGDAPPGTPPSMIDFSTGVSPLPPPPAILEALRSADLSRYPEPTALPLRKRLAEAHGVSPDHLVAGAGSVELIWALARAFAGPGRRALVLGPAFGEYRQAVLASGAACDEVRASEPPFLVAPEAARRALATSPSLVFLCRPSNPCLSSLPLDELSALARAAPSTLFVVDEAYLPMFDGVEPAPLGPNVVVLRSLTKVFALPGLRLGYLLAEPRLARAVQASLPPWNVSAPAQAAGIAAAAALDQVPAIRDQIRALRESLAAKIRAPIDAAGGPFLLCRVDDATAVTARLLEEGVRVRDCTSFGLLHHVRVGVRPAAEQERLRL